MRELIEGGPGRGRLWSRVPVCVCVGRSCYFGLDA